MSKRHKRPKGSAEGWKVFELSTTSMFRSLEAQHPGMEAAEDDFANRLLGYEQSCRDEIEVEYHVEILGMVLRKVAWIPERVSEDAFSPTTHRILCLACN